MAAFKLIDQTFKVSTGKKFFLFSPFICQGPSESVFRPQLFPNPMLSLVDLIKSCSFQCYIYTEVQVYCTSLYQTCVPPSNSTSVWIHYHSSKFIMSKDRTTLKLPVPCTRPLLMTAFYNSFLSSIPLIRSSCCAATPSTTLPKCMPSPEHTSSEAPKPCSIGYTCHLSNPQGL